MCDILFAKICHAKALPATFGKKSTFPDIPAFFKRNLP